jgi:hypothetical protein
MYTHLNCNDSDYKVRQFLDRNRGIDDVIDTETQELYQKFMMLKRRQHFLNSQKSIPETPKFFHENEGLTSETQALLEFNDCCNENSYRIAQDLRRFFANANKDKITNLMRNTWATHKGDSTTLFEELYTTWAEYYSVSNTMIQIAQAREFQSFLQFGFEFTHIPACDILYITEQTSGPEEIWAHEYLSAFLRFICHIKLNVTEEQYNKTSPIEEQSNEMILEQQHNDIVLIGEQYDEIELVDEQHNKVMQIKNTLDQISILFEPDKIGTFINVIRNIIIDEATVQDSKKKYEKSVQSLNSIYNLLLNYEVIDQLTKSIIETMIALTSLYKDKNLRLLKYKF